MSIPRIVRSASAALLTAALLASPGAFAAEPVPPPAADNATAQTLFEEGRRLMEAKEYAAACPKFEESQRLRPGTGTLLNLALCNEALGKTATAWGQFKEVLFAAKKEGDQPREAFAQEHINALEPKLSRLQVNAQETPGLAIQRDGQEIPAAALGTPIPIDPGPHTIEATAPGYNVWSTSIDVGAAEAKTVAIPKLTPLAPPPPPIEQPGPGAEGGGVPRRTVGFVVGGVGVAAVGVGAVLGIMAASDAGSAEDDPALCPNKRCTRAGRDAVDSASTKALISTIGLGVGIAAIGAGAVLILTSGSTGGAEQKPPSSTTWLVPAIGPGGGGLGVIGAF
jgi:hypothetical protein